MEFVYSGGQKGLEEHLEQSASDHANDDVSEPGKYGKRWFDSHGFGVADALVHYRGASFEVINPRRSLLLGENLVETPAAEIDLLIDDYLNSIDTM